MKFFFLFFGSVAVLVVGSLYLFPETEILSDHCTLCGRSRVYYHLAGDKYGSTIYNLRVDVQGDISPSHQHLYVDPEIIDNKNTPRWTLHSSGQQSQ